jgi:hypothetical protein
MTDEQRTRVLQRVKARVAGVEDLRIEWDADAVPEAGVSLGKMAGAPNGVPFSSRTPWTENELVEWICDGWRSNGATVLDEIRLTSDVAVVLDGHQLRIAELERAYHSAPRERLDPSQPYSEAEAEADVERVARVLMAEYGAGADSEREVPETHDPKPRAAEMRNASAWRREAALILSKVKGWQRGAPPSSPGHHRARGIFEGGEG